MVLSNKKLKQKLRSLLAESIADSESTKSKKSKKDSSSDGDINGELQSIKELLSSKSRNRRKKKAPLRENPKADEGSEETQKGDGEEENKKKQKNKKEKVKEEDGGNEGKGEKVEEETESNKRKRENEGDQALIERRRMKKEKKQKKKEEKAKKREEGKGEKEARDSVEPERIVEKVEEPIKIDESETKKLYVGGIPYYSSEDDIRSFFEGCGTVTEVDCMTFPESGKFRGIAILTFKTEAAAKRALALDGADMGGFYLKIQPYKAQRTQRTEFTPKIVEGYNRVYMGNLSWDITEDDLKQLFSDCKVSSIRFGTDKETGDFKGYAHVDFEDTVSLTIALKLDQKVVCGRPVRISCAVPKKGADANARKKPAARTEEDDAAGGATDGNAQTESTVREPGGTGGGGAKKKRRTCYECGVPGHLSSACPRKKAANVDGPGDKS